MRCQGRCTTFLKTAYLLRISICAPYNIVFDSSIHSMRATSRKENLWHTTCPYICTITEKTYNRREGARKWTRMGCMKVLGNNLSQFLRIWKDKQQRLDILCSCTAQRRFAMTQFACRTDAVGRSIDHDIKCLERTSMKITPPFSSRTPQCC